MAAWDEELGNLLPSPEAVGSTAPSWSAWVQDPVNRAGLLSFGTQLMTGGGGTFGQELGGALAKGFEGAAGTEALIEKRRQQAEEEAFKEQELAQRAALAGQQRATQLEVAKIGAASRQELERMRAEGRREGIELRGEQTRQNIERRAEVGGGAGGGGKGLHTKNTAFSQTMKEFTNRFPYASLDSLTDEQSEWIENRRNQLYMEGRGGAAPQGAPQGAAPQGAAPGATPAPGAAPAARAPGPVSLQELKKNPTIAPYLNTPEGREQIRKYAPQAVEEYERELQGVDYRAR